MFSLLRFLLILCVVFSSADVLAKSKKPERRESSEALSIVTGPKTGTYYAIGSDIADAAKKGGLNLQVKTSDGSIDNIRRINSRESAHLGIVQSDILGFLARSHSPDTMRMASNLRMILPLYREEVHILTRSDVHSLADLAGRKVIVGPDGSGHMLTAVNLFAMMDVTPGELIKKAAPEGIVDLLDGKVDAIIFVGGKPVRLFKNLEKLKTENNTRYQALLSQVHFLPLTDPRMLQEYQTGEITTADYDFVRGSIPTIAVTAVLVAFDYSGNTTRGHRRRCPQMKQLAETLVKALPELQEKGHPKWKEVRSDNVLPVWQPDSCAWDGSAKTTKAGRQNLDKDLVDVIRKKSE